MLKITSAGVLLFREEPEKSFLLLRNGKRWDVPKGHMEKGESEAETALRELREETRIAADLVRLDSVFRFQTELKFKAAYMGGQFVDKTYVVLLGYLSESPEIHLTEHDRYRWFPWHPPHHIQKWLIDPLLAEVERYFET